MVKKKVDVDHVIDSVNDTLNSPLNNPADNVNIEQGPHDINTDSFETTASYTATTPSPQWNRCQNFVVSASCH